MCGGNKRFRRFLDRINVKVRKSRMSIISVAAEMIVQDEYFRYLKVDEISVHLGLASASGGENTHACVCPASAKVEEERMILLGRGDGYILVCGRGWSFHPWVGVPQR